MTDKKTAAKPIDVADFDTVAASDKGYRLELKHPTKGTPLGIFINVLGKDSSIFREHLREAGNERLRRDAIAERKGKAGETPTIEQAERSALEALALCTTGWENMVYKGEELPFTTANALKLYEEQLWIRKQVDDAFGDLENFI